MNKTEPPPSRNPSPFLIGKDWRGNWVVRDREGLRGGLFVGRAEALKFAIFENGNRPETVVLVPGMLDLTMNMASSKRRSGPSAAVRTLLQVVWRLRCWSLRSTSTSEPRDDEQGRGYQNGECNANADVQPSRLPRWKPGCFGSGFPRQHAYQKIAHFLFPRLHSNEVRPHRALNES
jgi:hypothetical protein